MLTFNTCFNVISVSVVINTRHTYLHAFKAASVQPSNLNNRPSVLPFPRQTASELRFRGMISYLDIIAVASHSFNYFVLSIVTDDCQSVFVFTFHFHHILTYIFFEYIVCLYIYCQTFLDYSFWWQKSASRRVVQPIHACVRLSVQSSVRPSIQCRKFCCCERFLSFLSVCLFLLVLLLCMVSFFQFFRVFFFIISCWIFSSLFSIETKNYYHFHNHHYYQQLWYHFTPDAEDAATTAGAGEACDENASTRTMILMKESSKSVLNQSVLPFTTTSTISSDIHHLRTTFFRSSKTMNLKRSK